MYFYDKIRMTKPKFRHLKINRNTGESVYYFWIKYRKYHYI